MTPMYGNDWLFNIRGKVVAPVIGKLFLVRMDSESHRYSFCSNRNGAEAVLWAIENRMKPEIYNVADDYDYCLNDVLNGVMSLEGKKAVLNIPRFLPVLLMKLLIRILRGRDRKANWKSRYWKFFRNNVYSTARLKSTGFNARPHFLDVVVRGEPELHKS
jgi:nucleoside-diphosphate-sugar epimerase